MPAEIKAVVFRIAKLKETKDFFRNLPGFIIKEFSATHFVIHDKGLRILFVEEQAAEGIEIYLQNKSAEGLTILEDPNQIKIIIS